MLQEKIVDLITGEETFRDYTKEEIAAVDEAKNVIAKNMEAQASRAVEKTALLAKLGITEDEAKLLLS